MHFDEGTASVGENEQTTECRHQSRAVHRHEIGIFSRNHAVVVGEVALDEARRKFVVLRAEGCIALGKLDSQVAIFLLQDAFQDVGRLFVEDERGGRVAGKVKQAAASQFSAIGSHHCQTIALIVEEDTVHHGAQRVIGSGKERTAHAAIQALSIHHQGRHFAFQTFGHRIFVGILSHKSVVTILEIHSDFKPIRIDGEFEGLFGNLLHGILQGLCIDRKAQVTIALHQFEGGAERNFIVRSRKGKFTIDYLEEEIVQNRHAILRGNHTS